jgi:two-component system chemotaxis sensor kinase CheA
MSEMDDVVEEFLIESYENLDRLDRTLVDLEADHRHPEKLAEIFRTIHTIKGTCGFLGFSKLESISHIGENLLSRVRDGELELDTDITTVLLVMVDAIRQILSSIETNGKENDTDYSSLLADLTTQAARETGSTAPASAPDSSESTEPVASNTEPESEPEPDTETPDTPGPTPIESSQDAEKTSVEQRPSIANSSLRVSVELLDRLMNLVGELVLTRNQILQFTAEADGAFATAAQRLNGVTSELQEGVMKTRMQPIGTIWSKLPRVVRDLATSANKQVRIQMEGKDTDLDKTIIEAIKDPLTHLIRNSVDHGIEPTDVRIKEGKPAEGVINLRAYHEGGQVNIEIADDGRGIAADLVRDKAVQRGLLTADAAERLRDADVTKLIFEPGFSTAAKVTNVSGRGVGMDVVKTNIERIGGTVDIQSQAGEGTTLKIRIPLTLAIIPALMVESCAERFAIPQVNLIELVRLGPEETRNNIERLNDAKFYRLRGHLLPLVYLNSELDLHASDKTSESVSNIVVLKADGRQFGLVVDKINDTEEIVVKPLGKQLKDVGTYAGATIMGDGQIGLILDVVEIARTAHVMSQSPDQQVAKSDEVSQHDHDDVTRRTMLIFSINATNRMAMPLDQVARLEEVTWSSVERSEEHDVVQYRGEIMPLVNLTTHFTGQQPEPRERVPVIVFSQHGRSVGLVVNEILDTVTEAISIERTSQQPGVVGTAVIQQRVTDIVDVQAVVDTTAGAFMRPAIAA